MNMNHATTTDPAIETVTTSTKKYLPASSMLLAAQINMRAIEDDMNRISAMMCLVMEVLSAHELDTEDLPVTNLALTLDACDVLMGSVAKHVDSLMDIIREHAEKENVGVV